MLFFVLLVLSLSWSSSDSYGEDIGEEDSESYGSFDSEEDEYESDFIDDGDIEMFSSSPQRKSSGNFIMLIDLLNCLPSYFKSMIWKAIFRSL